jgi:hypothetical protein
VCAFQEAKGRKDRVDVITTKPEMSPEYMRSLSSEMNRELTAELCERIIWSGGGAEANLRDEDMMKERKRALSFWQLGKPGRGQPHCKTKRCFVHYVGKGEHSQASVLTCCT